MPAVVARGVLIVVALLAAGWLAAGLYSARLQARAEHPEAGDSVGERLDMLDRAGVLNPSVELDLRKGQILLVAGEARRSAEILRDVAEREPDNRFAWAGLVQALGERDPAGSERALSELRRLVPRLEDPEN